MDNQLTDSPRPQAVKNFTIAILRETGVNVTRLLGTIDIAQDEFVTRFQEGKSIGMLTCSIQATHSILWLQN